MEKWLSSIECANADIAKARELLALFVSENENGQDEPGLELYNFRRTFVLASVALDLLFKTEKKINRVIEEIFAEKQRGLSSEKERTRCD